MTPSQYRAARTELGWSHAKTAQVLGVHERTIFRYQAGQTEIPEPAARLLRLLVRLHLTIPAYKFNDIVEELDHGHKYQPARRA
jgi:transcriptional regulator with XRE-family HTH domain